MIGALLFLMFIVIASASLFMILHIYHVNLINEKKDKIVSKFKTVGDMFAKGVQMKTNMIANVNQKANASSSLLESHHSTDVHFLGSEKDEFLENIIRNKNELSDSYGMDSNARRLSEQVGKISSTHGSLQSISNAVGKVTSEYVDELELHGMMNQNFRDNARIDNDVSELNTQLSTLKRDYTSDFTKFERDEKSIGTIGRKTSSDLNDHKQQTDVHYPMEDIQG